MGPHSDDEMENESDQDFSDDEDYVDDISDADLMPDLLKQKPKGIPSNFLKPYFVKTFTFIENS